MDVDAAIWRTDPFGFLGRHGAEFRAYQPGAMAVEIINRKSRRKILQLEETAPGLFVGKTQTRSPYLLRVLWPDGPQEIEDPYAFGPGLTEAQLAAHAAGRLFDVAAHMGAIPTELEGVNGVLFSVWAPNARRVSVIGDFNSWDGRRHPMRRREAAGVWELFLPRLGPGERYKFEVEGADGVVRRKADPLGRATEPPPATASIVARKLDHEWGDGDWMAGRKDRQHPGAAISVYEVHAASWKRPWDANATHTWDQLGELLIPYVRELGFSHIELMPIMEHPFGGSWGYQPLSQFAPSARFGGPDGFARFVDRCHQAGLGVILDWVPAHFPNDAHGLERFDGTALYEHADPQQGFHPDWNTLIYNLGRDEVKGLLIASALWWLETFHVDGLRVDAVASMLYRDYSRRDGEWTPNIHGGRENLEAVAFLRAVNTAVAERCPSAITIAEESTAWPGVTAPVAYDGLGFDFKWNMGWMNDTLRYFEREPVHREWHGEDISFGLTYAFSERYLLPLSHDEVVHGKGSLISKMPGDAWRKFANLRALLSLMWTHPGKKLLFMGSEFAQWSEWNHDVELDWGLLSQPAHQGIRRLVADLNRVYAAEGALHHSDADPRGFEWLVRNDAGSNLFGFLRTSFHGASPVVVVINMSPAPQSLRLGAPHAGRWRELLNSDAEIYGGSGITGPSEIVADFAPLHGQPASVRLNAPPLGAVFLRYEGPEA